MNRPVKILLFILLALSARSHAVVILQYHHISDETPASTSTSPTLFAEHIRYLQESKTPVIGLDTLADALRNKKSLPEHAVVITFDDAYLSIYDTAFPLLKKANFPFSIFINTAPIDAKNSEFISWKQLKEMTRSGVVIANHTQTHLHMLRRKEGESENQWEARIHDELDQTESTIKKHLGQNHRMLAYPYGEYDNAVIKLLKNKNYLGFGQQSGAVSIFTELQEIPRFPMGGNYGRMNQFKLKVHSMAMPVREKKITINNEEVGPVINTDDSAQLEFRLESAIATATTCFYQGEAIVFKRNKERISIDLPKFSPGRARINCTARENQSGRYYWFSQAFFVRDAKGQWQHEL